MSEEAPKRPAGRPRKTVRKPAPYQQITTHLPEDLIAELDAHALGQGVSRAEVIRTACREFLRRFAKRAARQESEG